MDISPLISAIATVLRLATNERFLILCAIAGLTLIVYSKKRLQ